MRYFIHRQELSSLLSNGSIDLPEYKYTTNQLHQTTHVFSYNDVHLQIFREDGHVKASLTSSNPSSDLFLDTLYPEAIVALNLTVQKTFLTHISQMTFGMNPDYIIGDGLKLAAHALSALPKYRIPRRTQRNIRIAMLDSDLDEEKNWAWLHRVLTALANIEPARDLRDMLLKVDDRLNLEGLGSRSCWSFKITGIIGYSIKICLHENQQRVTEPQHQKSDRYIAFLKTIQKNLQALSATNGAKIDRLAMLPDEIMLDIFKWLIDSEPSCINFGNRYSQIRTRKRSQHDAAVTVAALSNTGMHPIWDQAFRGLLHINHQTRRIATTLLRKLWRIEIDEGVMRMAWSKSCQQIQTFFGNDFITTAEHVTISIRFKNDKFILPQPAKSRKWYLKATTNRLAPIEPDRKIVDSVRLTGASVTRIEYLALLLDYRFGSSGAQESLLTGTNNSPMRYSMRMNEPRVISGAQYAYWRSNQRCWVYQYSIGTECPTLSLQLSVGSVQLTLQIYIEIPSMIVGIARTLDRDEVLTIVPLYIEAVCKHLENMVQGFAQGHGFALEADKGISPCFDHHIL